MAAGRPVAYMEHTYDLDLLENSLLMVIMGRRACLSLTNKGSLDVVLLKIGEFSLAFNGNAQ